jgi:hypothetical protein
VLTAAAVAGVLAANAGSAHGAKPRNQPPNAPLKPWVKLPLDDLGVPRIPDSFLQAGASMLAVGVVDDTHLLLTFSTRGLVPRDPGDPPDDEDRMVAAELVELPSGRVVARTDWHMHDHGRYLWRLGQGRFLLRIREQLYLLLPEARMHEPQPLERTLFPKQGGLPVAALVSPDNRLLMVETMLPKSRPHVETASTGVVVGDARPGVLVDFFRMSGGESPGQTMKMAGAGMERAPEPLALPVDADGYLWAGDPRSGGRWPVSFNEFGGREVPVGTVDSSCEPRLHMVSRSDFLAFACAGTSDRNRMKAYGMDGHEIWEDSVGGTFGLPEFAFAPAAGRFAMSRISGGGAGEIPDLGFGNILPVGATQEVRVYQTESGDLLLKVQTSPVTRNAENFDLSDDGLVAAVVTNGAVEVFKLPPPSGQDRKDLEEARSFSPPLSDAPVRFTKMEEAAAAAAAAADDGGSAAAASASPGAAGSSAGSGPQTASAPVAGDVSRAGAANAAAGQAEAGSGPESNGDVSAQEGSRKPPTLLQPGESVEKVTGAGGQPH